MSKTIKQGIMLSITSWENDGDNYNTKTKYGLGEAEAKFWLALAQLCGGSDYSNIYCDGHRYQEDYRPEILAQEFLDLINTHHSGFAVATDGWDTESINVILNEEDDDFEEKVDGILSLASELVYDVLGGSEYYTFRVFDSYTAYLIPQYIEEYKLEV